MAESVRPIFVGDVQGCCDELDEILRRASALFGSECTFHFVGDLVNRGPHSLRVLERVHGLVEAGRASCVLGNHELNLIMVALGIRRPGERDTLDGILASADAGWWIDWLRSRPLVETGALAGEPYAMVHAAVHPGWDLETLERQARRVEARLAAADLEEVRTLLAAPTEQAPAGSERDVLGRLTSCRSVTDGSWSSQLPEGDAVAWHEAWSARRHGYGIVYGHWSLQGLHVAPGLRGLDTGCVHHGRGRDGYLTAWVPDMASPTGPFALPDDSFWQVRGFRRYYPL
jgi:bis(5'-nucleosyl)-tetraphosphatase (symmetrical)